MEMSRRSFGKLLGGAGAAAALSSMSTYALRAAAPTNFRATVGIFLYGGNDSWNMIVPADQRYGGYAAARGKALAIPQNALIPLSGTAFGLHPSMSALKQVWDDGGMSAVLNTGTLYVPLDKTTYLSRPDLRPINLMSHSDEQEHWQGLHARDTQTDGFLGRLNDRMPQVTIAPLMSFTNTDLILLGRKNQALILPPVGLVTRNGANFDSPTRPSGAREAAMNVFAQPTDSSQILSEVSGSVTTAYGLVDPINAALSASTAPTDGFFVDPTTGSPLTSPIARQLMRVTHMIAAHAALGHGRQAFFASQGGYDLHSNQTAGAGVGGDHADLLNDLASALAGFYNAMKSLGLQKNVTAFTMSDFGRSYRGNASGGSDHAWGGNHLVVGGGLKPRMVFGRYPDTTLGGADDTDNAGRFIPTIAQEEYIGAIMQWHGVSPTDMNYVFPNWSTWSQNGRGPVPLFLS